MYFAIETFAGHPGLQQTCAPGRERAGLRQGPGGLHADGAHGRGDEAISMAERLVAVSDSVFPNLDLARAVLSRVGAELQLRPQPKPEAILAVAREADALLVTYAKITADMIPQMKRYQPPLRSVARALSLQRPGLCSLASLSRTRLDGLRPVRPPHSRDEFIVR